MEIVTDIAILRTILRNKKSITFVPTMGSLHEGHLSLIQKAQQQQTDCVVVSIFVNQLQFLPDEDFEQYPRTLEDDCKRLNDYDVDIVFAPNEKTLYPEPQETLITPPPVANELEGKFRPGFFSGVTTVVLKLFNIIEPQIAIFGSKDYQQFHIVKKMVRQLNLPIKILAGETIRLQNGLALSSRNQYLNKKQQQEATRLYQTLNEIKQAVEKGNKDFLFLQENAVNKLTKHGWNVDYIELRNKENLSNTILNETDLVVLGAAWLNKTRLIDNLEIRCK